MRKSAITVAVAAVAIGSMFVLSGCAKGGASGAGNGEVALWTHNAGNAAELGAIEAIVKDFNKQSKTKIKVQAFPQDSYNQSVTAAAASKKLPCILDIDGPNVPNWAWAGYLAPLTGMDDTLSKFLPSTIGTYEDKTYSYGFYDVALAMFARKSVLDEYGIRIPTIDQPWTESEFADALATLKASGKFAYPADFSTAATGEWWPYAYSPLLQSFGGDLIDRSDYKSADGTLNGSDAVSWAEWFRGLAADEYIATKSGTDQQADFINGKTAIIYAGSWAAAPLTEKLGDDVLYLPTVDLGEGPKIGGGSWQWGMSQTCSDTKTALEYLKFAAQDKYVAAVAKAAATIPATDAAAAMVPGYGTDGKDEIFREFSKQFAVVRPVTPGYPFIATTFTKAAQDILNGADPKQTLDQAVKDIDANQKQNDYFQ
jgi:multiple sugar transport system substrate-binding protein